MKMEPLAIRRADAARLIGVSDDTLKKWEAGPNPPPHFRRSDCVIYPVAELRAWLKLQAELQSGSAPGSLDPDTDSPTGRKAVSRPSAVSHFHTGTTSSGG